MQETTNSLSSGRFAVQETTNSLSSGRFAVQETMNRLGNGISGCRFRSGASRTAFSRARGDQQSIERPFCRARDDEQPVERLCSAENLDPEHGERDFLEKDLDPGRLKRISGQKSRSGSSGRTFASHSRSWTLASPRVDDHTQIMSIWVDDVACGAWRWGAYRVAATDSLFTLLYVSQQLSAIREAVLPHLRRGAFVLGLDLVYEWL